MPLFYEEGHHISKEQYEIIYNIAYSISESIIANESVMYNGGSSKYNNQTYSIIRCITNAPLSLYYERKGKHWYKIGQNYNDLYFSFNEDPLKVNADINADIMEEPIYIDEIMGEGHKLIFLLKNGVHSLLILLSKLYEST